MLDLIVTLFVLYTLYGLALVAFAALEMFVWPVIAGLVIVAQEGWAKRKSQ